LAGLRNLQRIMSTGQLLRSSECCRQHRTPSRAPLAYAAPSAIICFGDFGTAGDRCGLRPIDFLDHGDAGEREIAKIGVLGMQSPDLNE